jgi:hypothetical protein
MAILFIEQDNVMVRHNKHGKILLLVFIIVMILSPWLYVKPLFRATAFTLAYWTT